MRKQYRQGDVLLEKVSLPKGERKMLPRDNGHIVLAYGEVTGHAHAICEVESVEYIEVDGQRLIVSENGFRLAHGSLSGIQALAPERIDKASKIRGLVADQDHDAFALPAGTYRPIQQREYEPEGIRNVVD